MSNLLRLPVPVATGVAIELLEYGKPCARPNGPVFPHREHGILALSARFPKELVQFCDPGVLGVGVSELAADPGEQSLGAVYRCLWLPSGSVAVCYRVALRPEDPGARGGRAYTIARYGAASPLLRPAVLHAAVEPPLVGLTADQARAVEGVVAPPRAFPPLDAVGEAFVREAVVYVASGIPVNVGPDVPEPTFFAWVDALWRALPAPVRPALSAGWNVGPSLAGELAVVCSTHRPSTTALFSPRELRWRHPEEAVHFAQSGVVVRPFEAPVKLAPGLAVRCRIGDFGALGASELSLGSPPDGHLPVLCHVQSPEVVRLLRWPGLRLLDMRRIEGLAAWLAGEGDQAAAPPPPRFPDHVEQAVERLVAALDSADRHVRAQQALFSWQEQALLDACAARGSALVRRRLALIVAARGERRALLAALVASAVDRPLTLPEALEPAVFAALDDTTSMGGETARLVHLRMLEKHPVPAFYARWLALAGLKAAPLLGAAPEQGRQRAVEVLAKSEEGGAATAARWLRGEDAVEADTAAMQALPSGCRAAFRQEIRSQWALRSGDVAARRATLVTWVAALEMDAAELPLLWASRGGTLDRAGVAEVVRDVEGGFVPPSLEAGVAQWAARQWPTIDERSAANRPHWSFLRQHWPKGLLLLVFGSLLKPESAESAALQRPLVWRAGYVSQLVSAYCQPSREPSRPGMIGMLWRLAADSAPSQDDVLVAPDMLRWLANGASTPGRPADGALDLTLRVARDAVAAGEAPLDPLARWACATAPWQLRLLLDLFPQEELVPTAEQLVALLPERCWLRQHFQTSGLEPNRRDRFLVASLDFQDQSAEARGLEPDPAWAGTPLLAALRGSSVLEPAVLASALVVYARSDQERVALCHRYLEACARQERLAAEAVFAALFVPALLQSVTPAEADLLLRQLAVRTLPRWVPRRRVPVQPANPGDPLVSFTNGEFRLASGIRELLRKVVALVGVRRARGLLRAVLDEEVP